jgi:8-oxo-dGTP pyrophosphatase MutT (NUDIX family)
MENKDLTLQVDETTKLNVRVGIILETNNGFVFTQNKGADYMYIIGGRARANETSIESAVRELQEEAGITLPKEDFKLISVIENFWLNKKQEQDWKFHEINFIFKVPKQEKIAEGEDSHKLNFLELTKEELAEVDVRPAVIKKLILEDRLDSFTHLTA